MNRLCKNIFLPGIMAGVIFFPVMNLSARENCEKLSLAVMADLGENLKGDDTYNELYRAVLSSLSGNKKTGKTVPVPELKNPRSGKCGDLKCVTELCARNGMDYLVVVKIRRKEAVRVGDYNKYLMKKDSGTVYSVSVRITDIAAKKTRQVFSENTISSDSVKAGIKKIHSSINKYFSGVKLCADDKQSDDSSFLTLYGISVSGTVLRPSGSYSDIADTGYGADIRFSSFIAGIKEFNLSLDLNAAYLVPEEERIESAYFFSPQVLAGYSFTVTENFSVMPYAGAGYVFHLIDGKKKGSEENSSDFYYNPAVSAGLEFSYNIVPGSSIVLSPACTCFFEQDDTGMYLMVSAGYRYEF